MTDFAWLIEAPGPRYLGVHKALGDYRSEFYWTGDAQKALRLISQEAADGVAMAVRKLAPELWGFAATLGEAWPREHGWLDRTPTAAEKKAQGARCGCRGVDDYCACQNVVQPVRAPSPGDSDKVPGRTNETSSIIGDGVHEGSGKDGGGSSVARVDMTPPDRGASAETEGH